MKKALILTAILIMCGVASGEEGKVYTAEEQQKKIDAEVEKKKLEEEAPKIRKEKAEAEERKANALEIYNNQYKGNRVAPEKR